MQMSDQPYLRRRQAAQYLRDRYGIGSWRTLAKYACTGLGPNFFKLGSAALYRAEDLDQWAVSRIVPFVDRRPAELGEDDPFVLVTNAMKARAARAMKR